MHVLERGGIAGLRNDLDKRLDVLGDIGSINQACLQVARNSACAVGTANQSPQSLATGNVLPTSVGVGQQTAFEIPSILVRKVQQRWEVRR